MTARYHHQKMNNIRQKFEPKVRLELKVQVRLAGLQRHKASICASALVGKNLFRRPIHGSQAKLRAPWAQPNHRNEPGTIEPNTCSLFNSHPGG